MSLKILHVLDHSIPLHSGYSFRTLAILREQRALGWETAQLTSSKHYGALADEEDHEGFHFYRTRVPGGGVRAAPVIGQLAVIRDTAARLVGVIDRTAPDIVHAHSPCLTGIAALQAARPRGIPVVYEMRASWEDAAVDYGRTSEGSLRYRFSRGLETWTLKRADAVTTICDGLRRDILSRGVREDRVTVIPNAVSPDAFPFSVGHDEESRRRLGLTGAFTLGFIGSFYGYEGLDLLIAAMPEIIRDNPTARLLLVGGGPEEESLRRQAAGLGISDRVIFAGRVPQREVASYYGAVDLLVYPRKSVRLTEMVTPLKPLEAMAQGKLLIASNVGGHRELIRDGSTGLLFEAGTPQAITDAVRAFAAGSDRWESMRKAGRRFIEQERNWRTSVSRYSAVYERAIASARRL